MSYPDAAAGILRAFAGEVRRARGEVTPELGAELAQTGADFEEAEAELSDVARTIEAGHAGRGFGQIIAFLRQRGEKGSDHLRGLYIAAVTQLMEGVEFPQAVDLRVFVDLPPEQVEQLRGYVERIARRWTSEYLFARALRPSGRCETEPFTFYAFLTARLTPAMRTMLRERLNPAVNHLVRAFLSGADYPCVHCKGTGRAS